MFRAMSDSIACMSCQAEFYPLTGSRRRICPACASRRTGIAIAGGVALAVVTVIVVVVATQGGEKTEPKPKPMSKGDIVEAMPPPPPVDKNAVTPAETQAITSCDAEAIRDVVKAYNHDSAFVASVRAGESYQKKCTRSSLLDWDILYAHEHLEHWKESEAITDRLVKEKPGDSDFWWWRGQDRGKLGNHEAALVDLRQSLADADDRSNGVQIDPIDRSAKPLGRRCETAFGLRWLSNVGVELNDSAQRQFSEAYLAGDCAKLDGKGQLAFAASGMKRTKLDGKLAGKKIAVMIDRGLGTTLVRREVADAAKLARGTDVEVMSPTGLATGATSTTDLNVGAASAPQVPIAIVDKLPDGVDAVIGMSFLWRFDVKRDGESFRATAPN
jgi:hypothetical protein